MIDKVKSFIKSLPWKRYFFDGRNDRKPNSNIIFGFKSNITSPSNNDLIAFENDLYDMIGNIEFEDIINEFQQILKIWLR